MSKQHLEWDVIIIGAGPSGTVAAANLQRKGYRVLIIERSYFPRFSIGESLLPQSMAYLEEAGLLDAVTERADELGFQFKNGAHFVRGSKDATFDFQEKFSEGWGTTYQVKRAPFDYLLAEEVQAAGVEIRFGTEVLDFQYLDDVALVDTRDEEGFYQMLSARFVLDASGFGRVLPRLLKLDRPSHLASRTSFFTHVEDRIPVDTFDRNKIQILVHPEFAEVWYWLIPFSDGRSSIGVVLPEGFEESRLKGLSPEAILKRMVSAEATLARLLRQAQWDTPVQSLTGYASDVSTLHGDGFALLGNAGKFLDPVFSSGVTIALKSASLATAVLDRALQGEVVDWDSEFSEPLNKGVMTFQTFVEAWYDQRFQTILFAEDQSPKIREMICSILAGYAWDETNPYVKQPERRLNALVSVCEMAGA